MENNQLLEYIFGQGSLFSPAFSRWIESSERFKSFAQRYKDKIRKKVTEAQKDQGNKKEALKDVLYELQTAYLMLRCDQFTGIDSVDHNLLKNGCFARFSRRGFLPPSWARRILA